MDYAVVISAIVLGLSVLATIAKFLDWFVHSDPKTMVRTTRWMLLLLVLACIPLLVLTIANQQWPAAMLIGASMLIVPTLLKWRAMFAPLRAAFDYFRPKARPFDMEIWDDEAAQDPEMVRRAAAILEAYLGKSSLVALGDGRRGARDDGARDSGERTMSRQEALDVLGLFGDEGERDEEREVTIVVTGFLDAAIEVLLDLFPHPITPGLDDHGAADGGGFGHVRLAHHGLVPVREIRLIPRHAVRA